jgi:glycerol-3-phosphate acyltransferase PlsY
MTLDPIQTSYEQLDVANLIPSFFKWMGGGALNLDNGGYFGIGFLLIIAMISLLIYKSEGMAKGAMVSSMITAISALLFLKMNWINNFIFTLSLVYVGFALYYLFSHTSEYES